MVVVGVLVVLALARVVPDFVRVVYPLQLFGYRPTATGSSWSPRPRRSPEPAPSRPRGQGGRGERVAACRRQAQTARRPPDARAGRSVAASATACASTASSRSTASRGWPGAPSPTTTPTAGCRSSATASERVLHLVAHAGVGCRLRYTDMLRIVLCDRRGRPGRDAVPGEAEHRDGGVLRVLPRPRSKRRRRISTSSIPNAVAADPGVDRRHDPRRRCGRRCCCSRCA